METPTPFNESSTEEQKIKNQLLAMAKSDQEARSTRSKDMIESADKANQAQLQTIIETYGWPTVSRFGEEVANAAWLIAQHADANLDFQKICLEHIQADPDSSKEDLGYLTDRIRVNEGRPQLFGTQWKIDEENQFVPEPIEDEENLDKRRAEAGMIPFEEYTQEMQKQYKTSQDNQTETSE